MQEGVWIRHAGQDSVWETLAQLDGESGCGGGGGAFVVVGSVEFWQATIAVCG
jgi:hypothetical protein